MLPQAEDIEILGASYLHHNEVIQIAGISTGERYSRTELSRVKQRLLKHPAIVRVKVRQEKNVIRLILKDRQCVAWVENQSEKELYEVDREGFILSSGESKLRCHKIPLIRGSFIREENQFSDHELRHILKSLFQIRQNYTNLSERLSELRINGDKGLTIFLRPNHLRVELPASLDSLQIRRFYTAVSYFTREKIKKGWVDLRGSEAVLHTEY